MKRSLPAILFCACIAFIFSSCTKETIGTQLVKEITIDTAITQGEDLRLELAVYGDEGDAVLITDKPLYAATSKLENESDMFTSVYHYASKQYAAGKTEHVTLLINHVDGNATLIYLNITLL